MKLSEHGLSIIKRFEGFSAKAYKDDAHSTARIEYSIGYGHQIALTENHLLKATLTVEQATEILKKDVQRFEKYVLGLGTFNQNQFDALVSMSYNLGSFQTGLTNLLRTNQFHLVPAKMREYNKSGGKINPVLITRREIESNLFESKTSFNPLFAMLIATSILLFKF